jgi:hypothetical protein
MKRSFGKWLAPAVVAIVLGSLAIAPDADAAGRGGGGGGGRGGGAGVGGGPGAGAGGGGGGARQGAQVNNSRADSRTTNVRSGSVNNVNVDRNVNVDVDGGWNRGYRPVAGAAVVGTAVAVGAAAASTSCTTVYSEGVAVQQCQ